MRQKWRQANPIDVKSFFASLSKAQVASLAVAGATVGGGIIYLLVKSNSNGLTPTPPALINSGTERPLPINTGGLLAGSVGVAPGKAWVKQVSFPATVQPGSSVLISMVDNGSATGDASAFAGLGFQVLSTTSGIQAIPNYWPSDDQATGRERFDLYLPTSSKSISLNLNTPNTNIYFYQ